MSATLIRIAHAIDSDMPSDCKSSDIAASTSLKTAPKLRCELITEFERLEEHAAAWERFWKADPAGEIFQTLAWARAWWRANGNQYSLHSLAVYDDVALIGILPLVRCHDEIQFLGAPQADYTDVLCEEERALEVLTTAFSALLDWGQWRECKLEHLPSHARITRYWRKLPSRLRRCSRLVFGTHCPTIMVRADCPDILRETASTKKMRVHGNRLAKRGQVNFRFIDTRADAQEHLQNFFRQHVRRQILMGKTSNCQFPAFRGLLQGLTEELDLKDQLRFGVLELSGTPIAYQLGFDANGKYTMYQQTFDVNWWDSHPGNVMLRHILLFAHETGKRELDFSVGDEPYKGRYTNCVKDNSTLYLEPGNVRGLVRCVWRGIEGGLYHGAVAARPLLQRTPRIYDVLVGLRRWVKGPVSPKPFHAADKVVRRGRRSLLAQVCAFIWQTEHRILFRFQGNQFAEQFATEHKRIEIVLSRFSDIADLLLENHDFPGDLDAWRRRLAKGDQLLIVREDGRATLALWTTSDPGTIASQPQKHPIDYDSGRIVYEHWSSPGADIFLSYRAALAFLVRAAAKHKHGLWVCCGSKAGAERKELLNQGFHPKYFLRGWRVCHWLRFQRVMPVKPEVTNPVFGPAPSEETVGCTTKN
jgi:CelD/BcsL family acetyltransferase involved in cellulose biosynthesis